MADYELLEDLEAFESDEALDEALAEFLESDEARRRRRRRPVPTGRGAGYYRPKPPAGGVTQAQLQAALAKISKDVQANAAGIKTVGARVDAVAVEQKKQGDVLRREVADRKKEIAKLKSNMQLAALLPLIASKTVEITGQGVTIGGTAVEQGTKLAVAPDPMMAMLPMMMSGDGLGGGGDGSSMLLMALAMSGGL